MTQPFPADLRILRSVSTATGAGDSLEAINTNLLMDRAIVAVVSNNQIYMLRKNSSVAPSGDTIVKPVIGPGRFFKYSSGGAGGGGSYSWMNTMDVLIVNSPPNAVPGGVPPSVSVGPAWPNNAYSWAALVAANPNARLVTTFPANPVLFPNGDGGLPAGAVVPSILLISGDSTNLLKSGKTIHEIKVNGQAVAL